MNFAGMYCLWREARLRRGGDMAYRAYQEALRRSGLLRWRFPAVTPRDEDFLQALAAGVAADMPQFVEHFAGRRQPAFYFDAQRQQAVPPRLAQTDAAASPLLARAAAILQRRFAVLGGPEIRFDHEVDWRHCLNHAAGSWPEGHWSEIDYRRRADLGDVKSCWEWNRHHLFVTLGRAFRHTGDERYVESFVTLLESWCRQNPPEMGIHYVSNLEIGLRCVSWLWAHHLMAPSPRYTPQAQGRLHLFLYYMARHLARQLRYTRFTGRNNHLIGDASCLAVWCLMYPEVKSSRRWLARSLNVLWPALQQQVLADGMHFELSFAYHQFVTELVLQVVLLLRRQGRPVPPQVTSRLEAMLDVVARAIQPDGLLPNFGDDDDASLWALHDDRRQRTAALLEVGGPLLGRRDWPPAAAAPAGEAAYWLARPGRPSPQERPGKTGTHGARVSQTQTGDGPRGGEAPSPRPAAVAAAGVTRLAASGIYILRAGGGRQAHFAMINNHPDPFPDSGHNHASLLQLLLWIDGEPLLVDGGTFRYSGDAGFRNALRGTHAHNTVVVDERDQAEPARNFGWLSRLRPGPSWCHEDDDFVVFDGYHDSYRRLAGPVRHRRSLIWIKRPCAWVVRDELTGSGRHTFRQLWHVAGEHDVAPCGTGAYRVRCRSGREMAIQSLVEAGDRFQIFRGDVRRKWSWTSPHYGHLRPRTSLSRSWSGEPPTARVTLFYPRRTAAAGQLAVEQSASGGLLLFGGRCQIDFGAGPRDCTASIRAR